MSKALFFCFGRFTTVRSTVVSFACFTVSRSPTLYSLFLLSSSYPAPISLHDVRLHCHQIYATLRSLWGSAQSVLPVDFEPLSCFDRIPDLLFCCGLRLTPFLSPTQPEHTRYPCSSIALKVRTTVCCVKASVKISDDICSFSFEQVIANLNLARSIAQSCQITLLALYSSEPCHRTLNDYC